MKQEILACMRTRIIIFLKCFFLCGQMASHTPRAMAMVERLQNPHRAYVAKARLLSCGITVRACIPSSVTNTHSMPSVLVTFGWVTASSHRIVCIFRQCLLPQPILTLLKCLQLLQYFVADHSVESIYVCMLISVHVLI